MKRRVASDPITTRTDPIYQYTNTPSCDRGLGHFGDRYWGRENYQRLLRIKGQWDPQNVFHHCQSIGSSPNSNCCPY